VRDRRGTIEYALYGSARELPSDTALRAHLPGVPIETQRSEVPDDWPQRWREFHRPTRWRSASTSARLA